MYKGFMLDLTDKLKRQFREEEAVQKGLEGFPGKSAVLTSELDSYLKTNGSINGTLMANEWFPAVEADIFISHSHSDRQVALGLAGWLREAFGLECFIDSMVWGYANDLLKSIDDSQCYDENRQVYDYNKRNYSTGHVHMMLSVALQKMIDKAECFFFLKPRQATAASIINETESPWIYGEVAASSLVERKKPERHVKTGTRHYTMNESDFKKITYSLETGHLGILRDTDLFEWQSAFRVTDFALDTLYGLKGLLNKRIF